MSLCPASAQAKRNPAMNQPDFPPFSLSRLLQTTFRPSPGERICVVIDLPDPGMAKGWTFLADA